MGTPSDSELDSEPVEKEGHETLLPYLDQAPLWNQISSAPQMNAPQAVPPFGPRPWENWQIWRRPLVALPALAVIVRAQ